MFDKNTGRLSGEARVAPKDGLATCTYCEVKPFCRIYERYEAAASDRAASDRESVE